VDMSDPSGAVIDVDGDGRLGVQDSFTQAYISTPTVGHWKNTYRKAARRAGMISAVRNSLTTRMSALAVSNMARWEIRAAIAGTPADYTWCDQTSFCNELLSMGYHVIIPDMGKSVYASQYYHETIKTMAMYPQLPFVLDTLLPFLQDSIHILNNSHNNYLIGYSMGARGALAIAENTENIFSRLVLISGEYDQTLMPEDNILTMYFGSYQKFPERWEGKDNLLRNNR